MDVGIGLPTAVGPTSGTSLLEFAVRAEAAGFASLGVLDRLAYPNLDALVSLAGAAAVTRSIRLTTCILLGPLRSAGVLAKEVATLDQLAGPGRLRLGMAVGSREDDYEVAGADFTRRGRTLTAHIETLRTTWADPAAGPMPATPSGPPILVGGGSPAALARAAALGDGWVAGGGRPRKFAAQAATARQAWADAGRDDTPLLVTLSYVALGPRGPEDARRVLGAYHGLAPDAVDRMVATTPAMVAEARDLYEEGGCDEVVFMPCSADLAGIDDLAGALDV